MFGRLFAQEDSDGGILLGFHVKIPTAYQTAELAHLAQIPIPSPQFNATKHSVRGVKLLLLSRPDY
jgi:hypothetical protein